MIHWLRLFASTGGGMGSIPSRGTKISGAMWHVQKKRQVVVIFIIVSKFFRDNEKKDVS